MNTTRRHNEDLTRGDILLRIGPASASIGCRAFAIGSEIHIDRALLGAPSAEVLAVIGHELCHVAQQRRGLDGPPPAELCIAADLEEEAEEWGDRLARGRTLPGTALAAPSRRLVQPLLAVGGRYLGSEDDLSERAQTALALIQGGSPWIHRAIASSAETYWFANESELVAGVQRGLHGQPLLRLRRLGVVLSPRKLLTLSSKDLNQILSGEESDEDNAVADASTRKILTDNGIHTHADFALVNAFLQQMGLADDPLFQSMSVADHTAVLRVVSSPVNESVLDRNIQKEAADFAAQNAPDPQAFADYLQFYAATVQKIRDASPKPRRRQQAAQQALDALLPSVQAHLRCPVIAPDASMVDLYAFLNGWINGRNNLGFPSLSVGALQVMQHTPIVDGTVARAQDIVDAYIRDASQFAKITEPRMKTLSQDGERYVFELDSKSASAYLSLDRNGCATLLSYAPKVNS